MTNSSLFAEAKRFIPGGVNSPVRAFRNVGGEPFFVAKAKGEDLAFAAFFGVKPTLILKGGMINLALMGDPNAHIPTPQPVHYREMFATRGGALSQTSITFVSQAAASSGIAE